MELRCRTADVPEGGAFRIAGEGHPPIAVFNAGGTFYAVDDTCTHGEGSLCEGVLEGCVIECPFHSGTFDVRTGEALRYPAFVPLRTYAVRVESETVVVTVK
jgi:nitrite reductase/ring-hydroxylating ferredoxin subunit